MSPELQRRIGAIRDDYISTIMSHLETANAAQSEASNNTAVVRRCLTLLTVRPPFPRTALPVRLAEWPHS